MPLLSSWCNALKYAYISHIEKWYASNRMVLLIEHGSSRNVHSSPLHKTQSVRIFYLVNHHSSVFIQGCLNLALPEKFRSYFHYICNRRSNVNNRSAQLQKPHTSISTRKKSLRIFSLAIIYSSVLLLPVACKNTH